jgi:thiol-disulfide isomerase/thioredoxin
MIEQYIRSHPEVIEQSLQSLENKRAAEEQERQKAALATHQQDLLNDPASPISGNPAGDVTVVEFFDYRCGYCKKAAPALTQLQQSDARVRVVYKDFPILGETSELAAKAALASNLQGKHRAFHEALLAARDDLTKEQLFRIAQDTGLDVNRLDRDLSRPEWQSIIERNRITRKNPRHQRHTGVHRRQRSRAGRRGSQNAPGIGRTHAREVALSARLNGARPDPPAVPPHTQLRENIRALP